MHIVSKSAELRRGFARHGMLEQVRNLGQRLEYVLARYDTLVKDLAGLDVPSSDFESRVQMVNREVGHVTHRLQELFVLEYEAKKAEAYASSESALCVRAAHNTAAAESRRPRRTAVAHFAHVAQEAEQASEVVAAGGF
jgi:hypothetical protein